MCARRDRRVPRDENADVDDDDADWADDDSDWEGPTVDDVG